MQKKETHTTKHTQKCIKWVHATYPLRMQVVIPKTNPDVAFKIWHWVEVIVITQYSVFSIYIYLRQNNYKNVLTSGDKKTMHAIKITHSASLFCNNEVYECQVNSLTTRSLFYLEAKELLLREIIQQSRWYFVIRAACSYIVFFILNVTLSNE